MHVVPLDSSASCQKRDLTHRKQVPLFHGVAQVMKLESAKSYLWYAYVQLEYVRISTNSSKHTADDTKCNIQWT